MFVICDAADFGGEVGRFFYEKRLAWTTIFTQRCKKQLSSRWARFLPSDPEIAQRAGSDVQPGVIGSPHSAKRSEKAVLAGESRCS